MVKKVLCPICKEVQGLRGFNGHLQKGHPEKWEEHPDYEYWKDQAELVEGGEGGEGTKEEEVGTKEEKYKTTSSKSVKLHGDDLHLAERLINAGLAENLTDLMRKALKLYGGVNFKDLLLGGTMDKELLKALKEGEGGLNLEKALAYKVIGKGDDKLMKTMIALNQMEDSGSNPDMGTLIPLLILSQRREPRNPMDPTTLTLLLQNRGGNEEVVKAVKEAIKESRRSSGSSDMMKMMLLSSLGNSGMSTKELLSLMKERDKVVEKYKSEVEKKDRELLKKEFEGQLGKVMKELRKVKEKQKGPEELVKQVDALQKLGEKLGVIEPQEKSKADTAKELVESFTPVLKEGLKAFREGPRKGLSPRQQKKVQEITSPEEVPTW